MLNNGLTYPRDPGAIVTFLIGKVSDPPKMFLINKEFACHASPAFDAAFNSNFIEGQTQTYKLDDTTTRAFQLLTQWMYFQKITISQLEDEFELKEIDDVGNKEDLALVELWVLTDKL